MNRGATLFASSRILSLAKRRPYGSLSAFHTLIPCFPPLLPLFNCHSSRRYWQKPAEASATWFLSALRQFELTLGWALSWRLLFAVLAEHADAARAGLGGPVQRRRFRARDLPVAAAITTAAVTAAVTTTTLTSAISTATISSSALTTASVAAALAAAALAAAFTSTTLTATIASTTLAAT